MTEVNKPTHGFTKHGLAVHAKIIDHMRDDTTYQRFNKKVALALTKNVGTMTAFWSFGYSACSSFRPSCRPTTFSHRSWLRCIMNCS